MTSRARSSGSSVVAIGGGSGLAVLLSGLKRHVGDRVEELSAVVTVADDGGSSGRLRRDFGVLPPGDVRACLVALADDEDLLARLFDYRFANGGDLAGHSFGNLFLTALTGVTGDFYQAILTAETILSGRGRILPATLQDVRLRARGASGRWYDGESAIGRSGEHLDRLDLDPPDAEALPAAIDAILGADLVLLGPGSLYTSILPNLLIPGIREALRSTRGATVLVLNLMTQIGETEGMSGADHLAALARHAGDDLLDFVVINDAEPSAELLACYRAAGQEPVRLKPESTLAPRVVATDLLAEGTLLRHDSGKLSHAVLALARSAVSPPTAADEPRLTASRAS